MKTKLKLSFGAVLVAFVCSAQADINVAGIVSVKDNGQVNIPGVLNVNSNKDVHVNSTNIEKIQSTQNNKKRYFKNKDLSRGDFTNQDFSNVIFLNVDGSRADFSGANFSGAVFKNSNFARANFTGANLSNTKFVKVNLTRATMINSCFSNANVINSNLTRVKLDKAVLIGTKFKNCELYRVSKKGAIYTGVSKCAEIQKQVSNKREILIKSSKIREALLAKQAIDLTINFKFNSDKITGNAHKQIFEIAQALKSNKLANSKIQIQGHTDSQGSADYNFDLSNKRAISVMRELVYKDGFNSNKFLVKGYGESQPIASNMHEHGRSLNRRVTLVNVSQ